MTMSVQRSHFLIERNFAGDFIRDTSVITTTFYNAVCCYLLQVYFLVAAAASIGFPRVACSGDNSAIQRQQQRQQHHHHSVFSFNRVELSVVKNAAVVELQPAVAADVNASSRSIAFVIV